MAMLNRKIRYQIIRRLISSASQETLLRLMEEYGFKDDLIDISIESKRQELLDYLYDMDECWNKNYVDLTDRQYIKILKNK